MAHDLLGLLVVLAVVLLIALVVAIYYGVRLWRLWALVHDPNMPDAARYAFYGALIYAICPVDLLPDPIYLDDVGLLVTAITYITKVAKRLGLLDRPADGTSGYPLDRPHGDRRQLGAGRKR